MPICRTVIGLVRFCIISVHLCQICVSVFREHAYTPVKRPGLIRDKNEKRKKRVPADRQIPSFALGVLRQCRGFG